VFEHIGKIACMIDMTIIHCFALTVSDISRGRFYGAEQQRGFRLAHGYKDR